MCSLDDGEEFARPGRGLQPVRPGQQRAAGTTHPTVCPAALPPTGPLTCPRNSPQQPRSQAHQEHGPWVVAAPVVRVAGTQARAGVTREWPGGACSSPGEARTPAARPPHPPRPARPPLPPRHAAGGGSRRAPASPGRRAPAAAAARRPSPDLNRGPETDRSAAQCRHFRPVPQTGPRSRVRPPGATHSRRPLAPSRCPSACRRWGRRPRKAAVSGRRSGPPRPQP